MHNKVPFRLILLRMVTPITYKHEVKRQHTDTTVRIVITLGGKL